MAKQWHGQVPRSWPQAAPAHSVPMPISPLPPPFNISSHPPAFTPNPALLPCSNKEELVRLQHRAPGEATPPRAATAEAGLRGKALPETTRALGFMDAKRQAGGLGEAGRGGACCFSPHRHIAAAVARVWLPSASSRRPSASSLPPQPPRAWFLAAWQPALLFLKSSSSPSAPDNPGPQAAAAL
jgi:hypothetical protein